MSDERDHVAEVAAFLQAQRAAAQVDLSMTVTANGASRTVTERMPSEDAARSRAWHMSSDEARVRSAVSGVSYSDFKVGGKPL